MKRISGLVCGTALAIVIATSPSVAADAPVRKSDPVLPTFARMPAVDGLNAKLGGFGGWIDNARNNPFAVPGFALQGNRSQALFGGLASVSVPLGERFGLQLDGLATSARGAFAGGGGAHLFTRDPSVGLLGPLRLGVPQQRLRRHEPLQGGRRRRVLPRPGDVLGRRRLGAVADERRPVPRATSAARTSSPSAPRPTGSSARPTSPSTRSTTGASPPAIGSAAGGIRLRSRRSIFSSSAAARPRQASSRAGSAAATTAPFSPESTSISARRTRA